MIYLIRTFGRGKRTAVKVGFSNNIESRNNSYKIQNPFHEKITTREGDEMLELKLHLYLTALGYKESFLNEWFKDIPEVLNHFHDKINKINKTIWKYRNNLFLSKDFKDNQGNKLRKRLYEDLRFINKISIELPIDKDWRIESQKKTLKNIKNKLKFGTNDFRDKI